MLAKRKRVDIVLDVSGSGSNSANAQPTNKSSERKITEYIKANRTTASTRCNGTDIDMNCSSITAAPISPLILDLPTHAIDSMMNNTDSNSNQSIASSSSSHHQRQLIDNESQTDIGSFSTEHLDIELAKKDRLIEELQKMNEEGKQQTIAERRKNEASRETIRRLLIEQSTMARKQAKAKCMEESLRLGQFKPERHGEHFRDAWTDGYAFDELQKRIERIAAERNEIILASQNLRKRRPTSGIREIRRQQQQAQSGIAQLNCTSSLIVPSTSSGVATVTTTTITPSSSTSSSASTSSSFITAVDDGFVRPDPPKLTMQAYHEQDEINRLRKDHLKKEECDLQAERDRLDRERNLHIKELKRVQFEEASRYKDHVLLNSRYLLLSLLGKGGFSEVWRAFDLEENRNVACKIHHVNKEWKEEKKANYVKHALREKDIHKTLDHPRIVKLFDLFTIDNHSFCTVLEYCDGNDLDFYLKQNKQIPEKEARSIIMQVVSALRYLSEIRPPVIHYDLKPANILLQSGTTSGAIKITDFGLSKVMADADDADSIELTSQGAGTYWYLPPETFVISHQPPKISSKVDVWSIGVILYQCLYGRRPFGHEQTQAKILEENTILKATEVNFPAKPVVSSVAQDFIRRCLEYRKEERADVHELVRHELFRPRGQKLSTSSSTQLPSSSSSTQQQQQPSSPLPTQM